MTDRNQTRGVECHHQRTGVTEEVFVFIHAPVLFRGGSDGGYWDFGRPISLNLRRSAQGSVQISNNDSQPVFAAGIAGVSPAHRLDIRPQLKVRNELFPPGQKPFAIFRVVLRFVRS